jgi:hypothetical protein
LENFTLREVEPNIFSVLPDNESDNEYDSQFGFVYDLVACNPIYNRLIWSYPVNILSGQLSWWINRFADKYLEALADSGKLISRAVVDHKKVFDQVGLSAKYETIGNLMVIKGN